MKKDQWIVIAGDTLDFQVTVPQYPATDGWTLKYRLTPRFASPVQAPVTLTAIANSDGSYQVQAGPATTAVWNAGAWTWARWVEKAGARQSLNESGDLAVRSDPSTTAQGYDGRSHVRKMVDAIDACLEARATTTQREMVGYQLGIRGQQFDQQDTRSNLVKLRSDYLWFLQNEIDAEKIAAGQPNPRQIRVRFRAP